MTVTKTLYSSNSVIWETPQHIFDSMDKWVGKFDLDVCALEENKKCDKFFSPSDDGLSQDWFGNCWMNPPYGKTINQWMKKAYEESQREEVGYVVCLIPSRTDTKYWHEYCMKAYSVAFVKGRLKFGGSKNSAPFPSAIVTFHKSSTKPYFHSI